MFSGYNNHLNHKDADNTSPFFFFFGNAPVCGRAFGRQPADRVGTALGLPSALRDLAFHGAALRKFTCCLMGGVDQLGSVLVGW